MLILLKNLGLLFFEFFKAGLFAVGGGLATVPFIREMGAVYGWVTEAEVANIIAIAESTPGPIGVNAATYVGYNVAGIPGSVMATIGLITPSVIIIILIAKAIHKYYTSHLVQSLFLSLRPAAIGLITAAGFSLLLVALNIKADFRTFQFSAELSTLLRLGLYAVFAFFAFWKKTSKIHPLFFILAGGTLGGLLSL
ncbi:MAG: chromate transporter [Clostridia bacterium]|nr:chromate transporter [Clostridia bacterium]MBR3038220.1 chromate transporter [Clostridia bacterium]